MIYNGRRAALTPHNRHVESAFARRDPVGQRACCGCCSNRGSRVTGQTAITLDMKAGAHEYAVAGGE